MSNVTISKIENAFLPSREIDSAKKFAGRVEQVNRAYLALNAEGSNIAIIGNRGIGKTSLARQVLNIATGDNDLLKKLKLPHEGKLDYLAMYHACGKSVKTFPDLLERLLTTKDCLQDWIYEIPAAKKAITSIQPKLDVQVASLGGTIQTESESHRAVSSHPVDTVFTNVVSSIIKAEIARNGILIVIDEFDQIEDPTGFASFLKSLSTNVPKLKFCLVGVAQDIRNLMNEHESSDRLFAGSIINLPPMSESELIEIITIAEESIDSTITFTDGAKHAIANLAQGHPYMVHLLGKYALRRAFTSKQFSIAAKDVEETLKSIAQSEADPVLEGRYKKAVASSAQRERVLKALAASEKPDGEVPTAEAYKLAIDAGVDNPSQYVGQLVTTEYGAEIVRVRERYYRFRDSLFRAYVGARPFVFANQPEENA